MNLQAPVFSIEVRNRYIYVVSEGIYDSPADLMEITKQIHSKALLNRMNHFLLNFTQASFRLPLAEAFNLIRTYELSMPAFTGGVAACIYGETPKKFIDYWQDVGSQRGYFIKLFKKLPEAEAWLLNQLQMSGDG